MFQSEELQRAVVAELDFEPELDPTAIGVLVDDGAVMLTGTVSSYAEKQIAESVARRVAGVSSVSNELKVELPPSARLDDSAIAHAALLALQWNSIVPDELLTVTVADGWITLEGTVRNRTQRAAAENAVQWLNGVCGVHDKVLIQPDVAATDLERQIVDALERHSEIEGSNLKVEAVDGRVILRGVVRSLAQRDAAEQTAWAARGVHEVDNLITVERSASTSPTPSGVATSRFAL